eukprot:TRINITY_DN559_c0_g1_i1.p2 TRINITY_DN559_c0_g1~~TRINITY_DN559_c0_g1_i1.p2  ORF type:complete len:158 (+),score=57.73 TRINITY_DN559_c0_g1_i1:72-545(+)
MRFLFLLSLFYLISLSTAQVNEQKCNACQSITEDIERQLFLTPENYEEQVGFRIDNQKRVPYARTEYRIMEVLDRVCGHELPTVPSLPLDSTELPMPTLLKKGEGDKFVSSWCEDMVEHHHDKILQVFHRDQKPYKVNVCVDIVKVCAPPSPVHDEL